MHNMRYIAFKDANGVYWNFNKALDGLVAVSSNHDEWQSESVLSSLSAQQFILVSGYELNIYTTMQDDVYKTKMSTYDILESTDITRVPIKGYSGITSLAVVCTAGCR